MSDFLLSGKYKAISCAECRRLKLRCDKNFPCNSCRKRGCAAICPNGLVPSSNAVRHEYSSKVRVEPLVTRIRDLEHALATLQATYHTSPHPLLRKDLREIASPPPPPPSADDLNNLSENLGTLSMTGYGRSRFYGPTGSIWPHIWNLGENGDAVEGSEVVDTSLTSLHLPSEILQLASAFPFPRPSPSTTWIGEWIVANMPPSMEAWSLCETFFENGAYIFIPLCRATFIDEVFAFFYRPNQKVHVDIPFGHRLASLLMVFAIGDMLDLTKPAIPTGGKRFYYLARAAISLNPLYDQPTLTAVQTLILMNVYLSMSDHPESAETVYVLSGVVFKLALMLGLHRESLKFTVNQVDNSTPAKGHLLRTTEEEMRRIIFHEVIHFEAWQSLMGGRPSLLHFEHFDCGPPGTNPERGSVLETSHMRGQAWSYGFIRKCLVPVLNYAVAVKPPPYTDVLKLDSVIRSHSIPQSMDISLYENEDPDSEHTSRAAVTLRFSGLTMKEIALLYLHRPYFACAMTDFSGDPLVCPFSKSVIASFVSACTIIAKISLLFEREPALSVRIWIFWNQLFVPSILGTIVTRSPSCSLASKALKELDKLCDLMRKASDGVRPRHILPHVLRVSEKAHAASDLYYSAPGAIPPAVFDVSAELSALAGKSRVSPASSSNPSPSASQSPGNSPPSLTQPDTGDLPAPTEPASVHSLFPEIDWSSFADFDAIVSSFPPAPQSEQQPIPQQTYDYTHVSHPAAGTDSSDSWGGDANAIFGQGTDQSYLQDHMLHPALEMQPTWQHFMTQMFGNSPGARNEDVP